MLAKHTLSYILNKTVNARQFKPDFFKCENYLKTLYVVGWISRNYHFQNKFFSLHSALCSRPLSAARSKTDNGYQKSCVSCNTLLIYNMDGIRSAILACGMSSRTSWIARNSCTMACGYGTHYLIWRSVRVQAGLSMLASSVYGLHLMSVLLNNVRWAQPEVGSHFLT